MVWLLLLLLATTAMTSTSAASSCYDNCSKHGECVNFICQCRPGWFGENCNTQYGTHAAMTVGSENITSLARLNELCHHHEHQFCIVGFSSPHCAKCTLAEDEYAKTDFAGIPFLRVDALTHKHLVHELLQEPAPELPFLLLVWNKRRALYKGRQTSEALSDFSRRRRASSGGGWVVPWTDFVNPPLPTLQVTAVVVGFFRSKDEDDAEMEEFADVALQLAHRHDVDFYSVVSTSELSNKRRTRKQPWFPPLSVQLPAVGVLNSEQQPIEYMSLASHGGNLAKFIQERTLGGGGGAGAAVELTTESFLAAEQTKLPMLLVFARSKQDFARLNTIEWLNHVAVEFAGALAVMYDANMRFASQMPVLGLDSSSSSTAPMLSMAINSRMGAVPFTGGDVTSLSVVRAFCIDYLAGRLKPHHTVTTLTTTAQEDTATTSEDTDVVREDAEGGIVDVSSPSAWDSIALDETKDVLVFVNRRSTRKCAAGAAAVCRSSKVALYFKAAAKRFLALRATARHHVVCAVLDLDQYAPNNDYGWIGGGDDPALVLLPATSKQLPFARFSAPVKVYSLMEWTRVNAGRAFEWNEDLPQFSAEDKALFKIQIAQRQVDEL